ncbi:hypothetical protein GIB67_003533, partial [Kingdonia uniflora]
QTKLSRRSRSRYSRRFQLILTYTRGELDQHLTCRLLVRPNRSNRTHSTSWLLVQPVQPTCHNSCFNHAIYISKD